MFFLQMSGFPGSGKSTLSRHLSKLTGAIIIDHDIVKSSLLKSLETNHVVADTVGKISYDIEWSLIDFHLSQGLSVIFDSPCFYTEMVEKGLALSKKHNVRYKYVECYLNNFKEIQIRLKERKRMISQISQVDSEFAFREQVEASKRPFNVECLVVDSGKPLDSYIEQVHLYIKH